MLLRHDLEQGTSKAELRRFGASRRTVHRWVESGQFERSLGFGRDSRCGAGSVTSWTCTRS